MMGNMNPDDIRDAILSALHDSVGVCAHCGKRQCAGRKSGTNLPRSIDTDAVIEAIGVGLSKLQLTAGGAATEFDVLLDKIAAHGGAA